MQPEAIKQTTAQQREAAQAVSGSAGSVRARVFGNTYVAPSGFGGASVVPLADHETDDPVGGVEDSLLPRETVDGLLAAADARLEVIRAVIADTDRTLVEFRKRREELATAVREVLAKTSSLRRADFDRLLSTVLAHHERRELEVERTLATFRNEEEAIAGRFRRLLTRSGGVRVKEFKRMIRDMHKEQDEGLRVASGEVEEKFQRLGNELQALLKELQVQREQLTASLPDAHRDPSAAADDGTRVAPQDGNEETRSLGSGRGQ